jgi:hypothetical protein
MPAQHDTAKVTRGKPGSLYRYAHQSPGRTHPLRLAFWNQSIFDKSYLVKQPCEMLFQHLCRTEDLSPQDGNRQAEDHQSNLLRVSSQRSVRTKARISLLTNEGESEQDEAAVYIWQSLLIEVTAGQTE